MCIARRAGRHTTGRFACDSVRNVCGGRDVAVLKRLCRSSSVPLKTYISARARAAGSALAILTVTKLPVAPPHDVEARSTPSPARGCLLASFGQTRSAFASCMWCIAMWPPHRCLSFFCPSPIQTVIEYPISALLALSFRPTSSTSPTTEPAANLTCSQGLCCTLVLQKLSLHSQPLHQSTALLSMHLSPVTECTASNSSINGGACELSCTASRGSCRAQSANHSLAPSVARTFSCPTSCAKWSSAPRTA